MSENRSPNLIKGKPGRPVRTISWFLIGLLFALVLAFFGKVIFLDQSFAFRDGPFFYHPLFRLLRDELLAGRLPLWNPHDNGGAPLLANPVTSVFYPLKIIFFLPLSYDAQYKTYLLLHVLMCAGFMYLFARSWKCRPLGAGFAAMVYTFSGHVIFQHSNCIFLVTAAWLPLILLIGTKMIEQRSLLWACALMAAMSMTVLGGDPQTGYHAGMVIAFYAFVLQLRKWRRNRKAKIRRGSTTQAAAPTSTAVPLHRNRLALLGIAAVGGVLLSAVQLFPAMEVARESSRSALSTPLSIWKVPSFLMRGGSTMKHYATGEPAQWHDTILGNPAPPAKQYNQVYKFSFEPFRTLELIWPNLRGSTFMHHAKPRWFYFGTGTWTPSIYMGLGACILALTMLRFRRGDPKLICLTWSSIIFLLGSFGYMSFIWLLRTVGFLEVAEGENVKLFGAEVGSIYWLFTTFLPGYDSFRFPAKLLGITTLGIALLSGRGLDCLPFRKVAPVLKLISASLGLTLLTLLLITAAKPFVMRMTGLYADQLIVIRSALLHGLVMCILLGALVYAIGRKPKPFLLLAIVLLTAVDLAVANRWLIITAPGETARKEAVTAQVIKAAQVERFPDDQQPYRIASNLSWIPTPKEAYLSGNVTNDMFESYVDSMEMLAIYNYDFHGIRVMTTFDNHVASAYFDLLPIPSQRLVVQPRRAMDLWNVRYFILPTIRGRTAVGEDDNPDWSTLGLLRQWKEPLWSPTNPQLVPQGEPMPKASSNHDELIEQYDDLAILYNPSAQPRAWIVHSVEGRRMIDRRNLGDWMQVIGSMVFPPPSSNNGPPFRDYRKMAVVEHDELAGSNGVNFIEHPIVNPQTERCEIISYEPTHVEIEATTNSPGLLVLADTFDDDWHVSLSTDGSPMEEQLLLRTNLVMRGVILPTGNHKIVFEYRPTAVYVGAAVSGIAWLLLMVVGVRVWQKLRSANT